jgi:hypothetical protein
MFTAQKEPESMHKEFGGIAHELAWMPQGSFSSFSGGSGTHYSYPGEDKVCFLCFSFCVAFFLCVAEPRIDFFPPGEPNTLFCCLVPTRVHSGSRDPAHAPFSPDAAAAQVPLRSPIVSEMDLYGGPM